MSVGDPWLGTRKNIVTLEYYNTIVFLNYYIIITLLLLS